MILIVTYTTCNNNALGFVIENADTMTDDEAIGFVQGQLTRMFADNVEEQIEIAEPENFEVVEVDSLDLLETS